jgi:HSP20 family protein
MQLQQKKSPISNNKILKSMQLTKSNGKKHPATIFSDFFDTDRFFNPGLSWLSDFEKNWPAVNIKEDDKSFKVELAVPGFKKEDIKVDMENDILTISAETKDEKNEEKDNYTRKEFSYSSFNRSFSLPKSANGEKIDAKYENGVLKLEIAKKEEAIQKNTRKEIAVK